MICFPYSWAFKHNHFSWYNLGSLSKDHNRNTLPTRTKLIPYLRFKTLKNNTLLHSTYQSSPYTCMRVPPLGIIYVMYPMVGKKSPRVLSYVSYKDMCCPKWLHCINFVHFGLWIRYCFLGNYGSVWMSLSIQFQMNKKERVICEFEMDFKKSFCWRSYLK